MNALSSLLGSTNSNPNADLGSGDELLIQMASTHPELVSSVSNFFYFFIFLVIAIYS